MSDDKARTAVASPRYPDKNLSADDAHVFHGEEGRSATTHRLCKLVYDVHDALFGWENPCDCICPEKSKDPSTWRSDGEALAFVEKAVRDAVAMRPCRKCGVSMSAHAAGMPCPRGHSSAPLPAKVGPPDASPELPVCDKCGEEHNESRVYGEVDICRTCYASAEYRIDQLTEILQRFIDGGRLESLLMQCANAGITPKERTTSASNETDALRAEAVRLRSALEEATRSLESASAWRQGENDDDDLYPWLRSRAMVARAALAPGAEIRAERPEQAKDPK